MTSFTFVTSSSNKIAEAQRILGKKLKRENIALREIQAVEVEEVVLYKVKQAFEILEHIPVMIEDTGLYISAWNGLPGALIRWFVSGVGTDGRCRMMHSFPDKSAWAKTVFATCQNGIVKSFSGVTHGKIANVPAGRKGFGWDSIFIPSDATKTFGEMGPLEKDKYSMRRKALEEMSSFYSSNQK